MNYSILLLKGFILLKCFKVNTENLYENSILLNLMKSYLVLTYISYQAKATLALQDFTEAFLKVEI